MNSIKSLSMAIPACLFVASLALGADTASPKNAAGPSAQDREFVQNAAQAGHAEVQTGKLASTKANSADVRRFGAQMVTDHGKANAELASIAKSKGIAVPS